jgi:hypothetical protein
MKKLLSVLVLLTGITAASLCAWEPEDLTRYPEGLEGGDLLLNIGAGLPLIWNDLVIPPLRFTMDVNVPLGELALPFFFGGSVGLSSYKYAGTSYLWLPIGARVGYHFNWNIDNLDTYAVLSSGWILFLGNDRPSGFGNFLFDFKLGARYFITEWFGFWSEFGYGGASFADIGLTFKF